MIFLTVGTQFPFDRLVKAVDEAFDKGLIDEEVLAQIGQTSYKPHNFGYTASLEKKLFDEQLKKASGVISHAGVGTIILALDNKKPLLVMPRLKKYGEVVNNHQVAIARKFEECGNILVAYEEEQLLQKIIELKSFVPRKRHIQTEAIADRIANFLQTIINKKQ